MSRYLVLCGAVFFATFASGCQSLYYSTMESLGWAKRDLLVESVEEARDSQADAKEQFQTALEQFATVVNFSGGELESVYKKLDAEFQTSRNKAEMVSEHIQDVSDVGEALFAEWEAELDEYENARLRASSEQKLRETRQRYDQLVSAMQKAESKMDPVLRAFSDHVLYLKHNLNAQAIASLKNELVKVETDIAALIKDMEASVAEADAFITTMGETTT